MKVIFSIDSTFKGKKVAIELVSKGDTDLNDKSVVITLGVTLDVTYYSMDYVFDKGKDTLQVSNILAFGGTIGCLAGCGIALAGPIYDCWRKSKGKKDDFDKCLDENSGSLSTSVYLCLVNCMQGIM